MTECMMLLATESVSAASLLAKRLCLGRNYSGLGRAPLHEGIIPGTCLSLYSRLLMGLERAGKPAKHYVRKVVSHWPCIAYLIIFNCFKAYPKHRSSLRGSV